jgi:hypothetical protein
MIAWRAHQPAPRAGFSARSAPAKQQASRAARTRQQCVPKSYRTAAEELHSLVHDMAAVAPSAGHQTLLQPAITETVHALASGDDQKAAESYSGDAQVRVCHWPACSCAAQLSQHHSTPVATCTCAAALQPHQRLLRGLTTHPGPCSAPAAAWFLPASTRC